MQFISNSEKDTIRFAGEIAKKVKGGEIIGLVGELGAGKTTFSKAFAKELGVKKNVTSPTFVLMKIYKTTKRGSSIKKFVHIDAYRLKSFADLEAIGALELFKNEDTLSIVEWADKISNFLPKKTKYLNFTSDGESRIINTKNI